MWQAEDVRKHCDKQRTFENIVTKAEISYDEQILNEAMFSISFNYKSFLEISIHFVYMLFKSSAADYKATRNSDWMP